MNVKLTAALAFVGGFGVGALAVWRAAGSHFRQVADDEIAEMELFYKAQQQRVEEEFDAHKEELEAEKAEEAWRALPENEVVEGPDGPTYKDQLDATTAEAAKALLEYKGEESFTSKPSDYIILTQREYEEGPPDDYDQCTVTYWALDGFLTDERDVQLETKKAIGEIEPAWFGEKSVDPNVLYIRNTRMKIDFEVYREMESYGKKVLGLGDDSG